VSGKFVNTPHPSVMGRVFPLFTILTISIFMLVSTFVFRMLLSSWQFSFLLPLAPVLCGGEAILSGQYLSYGRRRSWERRQYRHKEIIAIVILVRIFSILDRRLIGQPLDLARWWIAPFSIVLDGYFILFLALMLFPWWLGVKCSEDLRVFYLQPEEVVPAVDSPQYYLWLTSPSRHLDRVTPLRRLGKRFLLGAIVIALEMVVVHVSQNYLLTLKLSGVREIRYLAWGYFLIGLFSLSIGVFLKNEASWRTEKIASVNPLMSGYWLRYALLLIFAIGIVVVFLPANYNILPPGGISRFLIFIFSFIIYLLQFSLAIFFNILFRLLGRLPMTSPRFSRLPAFSYWYWILSRPGSFYEYLQLVGLWILRLAILAGIVLLLLHGRKKAILKILRQGFWKFFYFCIDWWGRWREGLAQLTGKMVFLPIKKYHPPSRKVTSGRRFPHWSKLGPAELIKFFYYSILRTASRIGYSRKIGQTPLEYQLIMEKEIPEVKVDLNRLTHKFVEAKYSFNIISGEDSHSAYKNWRRIKSILSRRRKRRKLRGKKE